MPKYRYLVLSADGKEQEMQIDAPDLITARRQLARKNVAIIQLLKNEYSVRRCFLQKKFDVCLFTARLAPLLEADIPLEKALAVLEDSVSDENEIKIIRDMRRLLHEGKSFSEIITEKNNMFPPFYAGMVAGGEEAGELALVLQDLRRFLQERKEFRDFIITSSIYPMIVGGVTFSVVILLFTVFIPRFAKIFAELGKDLPTLTAAMLQIGNIMQSCWWIWPLMAAGAIACWQYRNSGGKIQSWYNILLIKIPLLGKICITIEIERFFRTMAVMVQNRIHLLKSVEISTSVLNLIQLKSSIISVGPDLKSGLSLSEALAKSKFVPRAALAMLRIAEESGDTGVMLERIANEMAASIRTGVKRILALLEPVIILLLAIVVLLVVAAIFLAIMEMNVIK